MRLLTYVPPKFSDSQLEILARHLPANNPISPEYGEYSFNILSNGLRACAEGLYKVEPLYLRDYRNKEETRMYQLGYT